MEKYPVRKINEISRAYTVDFLMISLEEMLSLLFINSIKL